MSCFGLRHRRSCVVVCFDARDNIVGRSPSANGYSRLVSTVSTFHTTLQQPCYHSRDVTSLFRLQKIFFLCFILFCCFLCARRVFSWTLLTVCIWCYRFGLRSREKGAFWIKFLAEGGEGLSNARLTQSGSRLILTDGFDRGALLFKHSIPIFVFKFCWNFASYLAYTFCLDSNSACCFYSDSIEFRRKDACSSDQLSLLRCSLGSHTSLLFFWSGRS